MKLFMTQDIRGCKIVVGRGEPVHISSLSSKLGYSQRDVRGVEIHGVNYNTACTIFVHAEVKVRYDYVVFVLSYIIY